jgi:probable rRNA maturation factor
VTADTMLDPSDPRRLHVAVSDALGRPVRAGALASWLCSAAPARASGTVSIALVDDRTMRRCNRRFAGKDKATDVLSFPAVATESPSAPAEKPRRDARVGNPTREGGHLGDIMIATGVARRQARAAGHTYDAELRVLALHGLLHLLGYDHETDDGTMARVEARIRRKAGLAAGVIERAGSV